jgi:hypothetical protein
MSFLATKARGLPMQTDLLASLRERLAEQQAIVAAARQYIEDLKTAIGAIESKRRPCEHAGRAVEVNPSPPDAYQRPGRGELRRVALDCIRGGRGTPKQIKQACLDQGVPITKNSISNVIQRLQAKEWIVYDAHQNRYVICDEKFREQLVRDLEESKKLLEEGSRVVALKPSDQNGAAGMHPLATALHTTST